MSEYTRPREVVFWGLKDYWGITHLETLSILGTSRSASYYATVNRSMLTRQLVKEEPGLYDADAFRPFSESAADLISTMHRAPRGPQRNGDIALLISGELNELMADALDRYGFDVVLYRNAIADIMGDSRLSDADRAQLLATVFCESGCTGDVRAAVDDALTANRTMGARFITAEDSDGPYAGIPNALALLRVDSGGPGGHYILDDGPRGTEIGRQPISEGSITDVDMSVSKRHALIWRDADGRWWVKGLNSTNGTALVDSATQTQIIVEPPRSERHPGEEYKPVEIRPGDILELAGTTHFLVQG